MSSEGRDNANGEVLTCVADLRVGREARAGRLESEGGKSSGRGQTPRNREPADGT